VYEDVSLIATILLLLASIGVAILYYRRIKRAHEMYDEAKNVVGDIVVSFNRQLQRQEDRLGTVAYKTEVSLSRSEGAVNKVKAQDKHLSGLAAKVEDVSGIEKRVSAQIEDVRKKVEDVIAKQKKFMKKTAEVPAVSEAKIKAAIPIKRERALAPLTETELSVLEILAAEGKKTAPEIRDKIKLTREHTARLMKKLYEKGYLEREAGKMPYSYSIKEEMRRILKKTEAKT
jgi:DNA-binding MarR family transcriptional regulator